MEDIDLSKAVQLIGGVSHNTYRIDDKVYRSTIDFKDDFASFDNENIVLSALKGKHITEEIIEFDTETGEKFSKFIDKTTPLDVKNDNDLIGALNLIKQVHHLELDNLGAFSPFERLNYYKVDFESPISNERYEKIVSDAKNLYKKYPLVVSHNDLLLSNFLKTSDTLYLIDFEFAGYNIELFDLASFISENNIDKIVNITAILHYFNENYTFQELEIMMKFLDLLWYYWALFKHKYTSKQVYLDIANEKLERMKQ